MPQSNAEVEIPGVDDHATWDEEQGVFRVAIDGSAEFAAMAILPTAFSIEVQPYSVITLKNRVLSPAAQLLYDLVLEEAVTRARRR